MSTDGDTASEREGYVRDRSNVRRAASLAAPAVPSVKPVTVSADTPKVIGTDPLQSVPVAAVPDRPQTVLPVEPSPAQVTAAGYKKRVPKALPADSDGFDRFATPAQDARPRSAEAVRNRLDNFKSGKTRATVDGEPQRENQAGAVQTTPENDPAAHEQGA